VLGWWRGASSASTDATSSDDHAMQPLPSRRCALATLGAAALAAMTAPAVGQSGRSAALARTVAPGGRLRACINLGNAVLAKREPNGDPGGVSVDLARAFAGELGVDIDLVVVDAAIKAVEAVRSGSADIGFFAVDPSRSAGIRFTAPYVLIEGAYLVRRESPLSENAQVDRAGTRVMVAKGSAYDLFLSRELKQAQLERTVRSQDVVDAFLAERADVAAAVKQQLEADAARLGDRVRLLPGRFMVIEQAMGLPAERGEDAWRALRGFVERAKASGFVAEALKRHGVQGAVVAPAAP
jgi:polar amino acid transport system substrate-binding protein